MSPKTEGDPYGRNEGVDIVFGTFVGAFSNEIWISLAQKIRLAETNVESFWNPNFMKWTARN